MVIQQDSIFNELRLRMRLLEQQNEQLAELMEQKLLLWLASDTIYQAGDVDELMYNLLERICMILELPYAACCKISNDQVILLNYFSANDGDYSRVCPFSFASGLTTKLKSGSVVIDHFDFHSNGFDYKGNSALKPESVSIFPFQSLYIPFGVFIFFDKEKGEKSLSGLSIIIKQIINMAVEKLEKLTLLEELKILNASFETKVRDRTIELSEKIEKLEQEISSLQFNNDHLAKEPSSPPARSNEDWSSLLLNLSHEIRTPLNGILGFSEIIRSTDLSPMSKEKYTSIIKTCGKSILKIIEDIIDLDHIEEHKIKLKSENFDIGAFLTDLYDHFKNDDLFRQKDKVELRLNTHIDSNTLINSDRTRVRQILMNLIGNAIKYTEEGFVEFGCKIQESGVKKKAEQEIVFFVNDTGIGIVPEFQGYIFERFVKLEHEFSKMYGGTGLGLSIAKDLAGLLRGRIWFDSEPGIGSHFYFSLPVNVVTFAGKELPMTSREIKNKFIWTGKQAMVVEDDEMSLIYLKEVLKSTQIEILHAKNGKQAVEMFRSNPNIDIILMDIKLPEMDGYEATRQIKQIKPTVPIIAQTAYAMADDHQKSLQVGCDDYISKPINRRKLLETMESFIHR
jgi:signal transduction histidine kinase/CheY-like chemotaxis protein